MTQEESLAKAKRQLKRAKSGKEVAEAMRGHFKNMVIKQKATNYVAALKEYSTPLF